ncbi:hypothetical protein JCGZ_05302 [Jatropha curcas]|uniref:Uncharacterized protein n=1 Tax=Jatropha curcas TaxID=180498 RepID=A0A067J9N7_JATCU|nr:hypothetical protein JCGZ_05302 [Jatropha curcas]
MKEVLGSTSCIEVAGIAQRRCCVNRQGEIAARSPAAFIGDRDREKSMARRRGGSPQEVPSNLSRVTGKTRDRERRRAATGLSLD